MSNLEELRWNALKNINFPINILKQVVRDKFKCEVKEDDIDEFIKKIDSYTEIDDKKKLLFLLERNAFKKLSVFSIKSIHIDEICNFFKLDFINRNQMMFLKDNEQLIGIGEELKCTYYSENERYFIIKQALVKTIEIEQSPDSYSQIKDYEYYDFVKYVIDKDEEIVFMFYNDINSIAKESDEDKSKIFTKKKMSFYNMFTNGNKYSLKNYSINCELDKYIFNLLEDLNDSQDNHLNKTVTLIETEDPKNSRNNYRSGKIDGKHNIYSLNAIKYSLENEGHNVKSIWCIINDREFLLKNKGEIILTEPYFGMEVIEDVCKEIFADYSLYHGREQATGTNY